MILPQRRIIEGFPFSIIQFEEIDSTNRFLKDYGRRSPENGLIAMAGAQTAGRGRFGNTWHSPKGQGLYFSMLLHPVDPRSAMAVPLIAGVVLHKTLEEMFPAVKRSLDLKWPNDVLIERRKVAGVLVELEHLPAGTSLVVVGIGVNCNQNEFPAQLPGATSLRLHVGARVDPVSLLDAFLIRWHDYAGASDLNMGPESKSADAPMPSPAIAFSLSKAVADWKDRSTFWKDRAVRFNLNGETLEGATCDVAPSGALLVRLKSGRLKELLSGEVEWIRNI
ncbi:MAG TPA: biotin--[acetyl-CoA-carboxylase] ligase [Acidobacteriota bacterium]